jgi:hypothetical protein
MWGDHDDTDEQNALRKVEDNDGSLSESTLPSCVGFGLRTQTDYLPFLLVLTSYTP